MKKLSYLLCLALLGVSRSDAAKASKSGRGSTPRETVPAAGATLSFDAFRLIGDRNIFSPYRSGRAERSSNAPTVRIDAVTLVGTMSSEQGTLAFFDGSEAGYRKALRAGESVGPFKVTRITANSVDLERDGQTVSMRVSEQFRKPEGADWRLVGAEIVRAQALETAGGAGDAKPAAAIPSDASETLRRLMEQRQKQLKQ